MGRCALLMPKKLDLFSKHCLRDRDFCAYLFNELSLHIFDDSFLLADDFYKVLLLAHMFVFIPPSFEFNRR